MEYKFKLNDKVVYQGWIETIISIDFKDNKQPYLITITNLNKEYESGAFQNTLGHFGNFENQSDRLNYMVRYNLTSKNFPIDDYFKWCKESELILSGGLEEAIAEMRDEYED